MGVDGANVFVAGSAPPLEDCFHPERVPERGALWREHAEHAAHLAAAGADLVLVEAMGSSEEATAAVAAAGEAGLPAVLAFLCREGARLLSGEPLREAIERVDGPHLLAVGVNCLPPSRVEACLGVLRARNLPVVVYPNVDHGEACPPEALARFARDWWNAGVRIVGGCCGTTPAHVRALAAALPA